ncbi:putative disease resistance protein [Quercus suber]|uniref:Disease resistance protein n=3 Tax=Quercus suber TaxID=58331 RepID=A0AAW0JVK1_QUESU
MKGLKVLSLFGMSFPSLPQSINVLQNLRTLRFLRCKITDVSAIGELRKLEILSFIGSKIEELPEEMRNLSYLKLLELTKCRDLKRIPPDLLSSLSNLEELYIFGVDANWKPMEEEEAEEEEKEEKKGANASLTELMSLSYLMALKIEIPNIKVLPKDLPFKNETIKFQIRPRGNGYDDSNYLFKNSLVLESCDLSDIAERQMLLQLLKRSEILRLKKIKDLKNIAYELDKEGFQCLKVLEVVGSEDVEYVMDATSYLTPRAAFPILESLELVGRIGTDEVTNLEKHKTTDIQQHTGPFPESTPIISHKLFSSNTILWPPNLENLELLLADSLEVVFDLEGLKVNEDHQRIAVLAQLKTLQVQYLYELTYVWKNVPLGIQGFQKLTSIEVIKCHRLRYLFPTSIAKLLVELQSITIRYCEAIENIVQRDGEEEAADIKAYSFEWSSIKCIYLDGCPKLKTIGSEIQSPRKSKKINRELDSRPNEQELGSPSFLWRCLECVPRRKNYSLMTVSDQGTTNKSQRSYSVKEEGTLTKLKDPKVDDIDNPSEIRSLFPSHMIEWLKNLESIILEDCDLSHEVIFQLEELNVGKSHVASVLDLLRHLTLRGLNNLMHIWKKGPERILGFGNVRYLKVVECNSLTYLFSPSIAKLLVMLEDIIVIRCGKIEEILARAREEEEEKDVLFHKVNSILLNDLPNLKCFCNEANALEWPSLKKVTVKECPSLSTFIPSNLKTPKLEVVDDYRTNHWKGELNATIEHIFKGKEKQANHETEQGEQIETIEKDM